MKMKKILISMVAALALLPVFTSCSNDDDNKKTEKTAAESVEGTYVGGTYANCKYFQNYQPTKNDTVYVKATQVADAVTLSYTSKTWGEFTFDAVKVTKQDDGSFALAGEGKTLMPSMKGEPKEYAANFEGTVSGDKLVATFDVPAVMGGTTVLFNPADFEDVLKAAEEKE
jgi:hypothetical protein